MKARATPAVAAARRLAPALIALAACGAPPPAPPASSPHPVTGGIKPPRPAPGGDGSATATVAADEDPICSAIQASNERVIARAWAISPNCYLFTPEELRATFRCHPTARGAWALVLDALWAVPGAPGVNQCKAQLGRHRLLHLTREAGPPPLPDPDAPLPEGLDAPHTMISLLNSGRMAPMSLELFDWSGDGEPEAALEEVVMGTGGVNEVVNVRIFTADGGEARPYPPARGIKAAGVSHLTNDSRPDLVVVEPYTAAGRVCTGGAVQTSGLELVAHARPDGTFSQTDAEALEYTRRRCPPPTSQIVKVNERGEVEARETAENVICARLRGRPAAEVEQALRKGCPAFETKESCAPNPQPPGACPLYLLDWARAKPPFLLRDAPASAPRR